MRRTQSYPQGQLRTFPFISLYSFLKAFVQISIIAVYLDFTWAKWNKNFFYNDIQGDYDDV